MIIALGEILRNKLSGFTYVDRLAGVVQVAEKKDISKKISRFPIACNVSGLDCGEDGLLNFLIPDDRKKSVIYLEDLSGALFLGRKGNDLNYNCRIRLIGWLNLKKLGHENDCSVTAKVVAHIITRLESSQQFNDAPFTRISITAVNQQQKSPVIFNKYTYVQSLTQFLMHPFDYFAIDFVVNFTINKNCVPEFNANVPEEC